MAPAEAPGPAGPPQRAPRAGAPRAGVRRVLSLGSVPPPALIVLGIISVQVGAGLAKDLFDRLPPSAVVSVRLLTSAVVLGFLTRRALRTVLRDHSGSSLAVAACFGLALALMNFSIYQSFARIPLGVAVTIEFLGPLSVAILASRRALDALWAVLAGTGVVMLARGGAEGLDPVGVAFALLAGLSYGVYATAASVLITRGEDGRAVVAALFGAAAVPMLPVLLSWPTAWLATGPGALIALYLGVVTTGGGYLLFARGLRTTPATTATTLTLAEPGVAAVLGTVLLGESLGAVAAAGLALLGAGLVVLVVPITPNKLGRTRRKFRTAR